MWHVKNKDNNNNNRCTQLQLLNLQNLSGSHLVGGVALSTPARDHPDSNFDGVSAIGIILIGIIPPLIYIKSNFVLTLGQLDTSLHLCKVKEGDSYKLDFTKKGQRIKKLFISQFIKKKRFHRHFQVSTLNRSFKSSQNTSHLHKGKQRTICC